MRTSTAGIVVLFGIWLVSALAAVGISVGVICVAVHFIRKFW